MNLKPITGYHPPARLQRQQHQPPSKHDTVNYSLQQLNDIDLFGKPERRAKPPVKNSIRSNVWFRNIEDKLTPEQVSILKTLKHCQKIIFTQLQEYPDNLAKLVGRLVRASKLLKQCRVSGTYFGQSSFYSAIKAKPNLDLTIEWKPEQQNEELALERASHLINSKLNKNSSTHLKLSSTDDEEVEKFAKLLQSVKLSTIFHHTTHLNINIDVEEILNNKNILPIFTKAVSLLAQLKALSLACSSAKKSLRNSHIDGLTQLISYLPEIEQLMLNFDTCLGISNGKGIRSIERVSNETFDQLADSLTKLTKLKSFMFAFDNVCTKKLRFNEQALESLTKTLEFMPELTSLSLDLAGAILSFGKQALIKLARAIATKKLRSLNFGLHGPINESLTEFAKELFNGLKPSFSDLKDLKLEFSNCLDFKDHELNKTFNKFLQELAQTNLNTLSFYLANTSLSGEQLVEKLDYLAKFAKLYWISLFFNNNDLSSDSLLEIGAALQRLKHKVGNLEYNSERVDGQIVYAAQGKDNRSKEQIINLAWK